MMGYRLDEIVGKNHRMFVDPDHAASETYLSSWAQLNAATKPSEKLSIETWRHCGITSRTKPAVNCEPCSAVAAPTGARLSASGLREQTDTDIAGRRFMQVRRFAGFKTCKSG